MELAKHFSKELIFKQEKFAYKYNSSQRILYKYYYGSISMEDIKSSWLHAFENNIIPNETSGFILDYRNATFDMEIDEHEAIADFYKNNLAVFQDKKIAIISDEPKAIVIAILTESKDDGYYSKPFSTVEAAIAWILYSRIK